MTVVVAVAVAVAMRVEEEIYEVRGSENVL